MPLFPSQKAPDEGLFLPLLKKYAWSFAAAFIRFPTRTKTDI
jgi:hypothetical protein